MRLKDLHKAADAAGRKAAENCRFIPQEEEIGFAFIKFAEDTPWAWWAKSQGYSIRSSKKEQVMMIREYDASMPQKIAYTYAYANVLQEKGIKVRVKIEETIK